MRWFFSVCSAVLVAAYAALVITCNLISPDLTGPQDNSFFNPSFYGLAPGAAGGLTAAGADGQVSLAWDAAANTDYYEVFYGATADVHGLTPLRVTGTYTVIKELENNTEYYVWVRGMNSLDMGKLQGPVRATPRAAEQAPDAPEAPRAQAFSERVVLTWLPVEGAASYTVWKGTSGNSAEALIYAEDLEEPGVTVEGLINETVYYFWITAKNAVGESGLSGVTEATPAAPPAAPGMPVLTADDGELSVSWTAVTGAAEYEVYYGEGITPEAAAALWTTTASLTTTITGLSARATYAVRLRAKNASGVSGYGAAAYRMSAKTGLYKGAAFGSAAHIGVYNLTEALNHISANALNGDNYFIVLGENQECAPQTLDYSGSTVGITLMADGAERTVQLSATGILFTVRSGVTLTLERNVTLNGRADNTVSVVLLYASTSGTFTMNGGKISGNTSRTAGGVVAGAGTTFTMNGGEISGNTGNGSQGSYFAAGGVRVASTGMFIMNGGTISGNTAFESSSGGGVDINGGGFIMSGGAIISGNTGQVGGGVGVNGGGTFTMDGGTISGNTASYGGGGVYIGDSDGTFTKSTGGVVYGSDAADGLKNSASSGNGHAVYRNTGSKKRNGTIPAGMTFDSTTDAEWD